MSFPLNCTEERADDAYGYQWHFAPSGQCIRIPQFEFCDPFEQRPCFLCFQIMHCCVISLYFSHLPLLPHPLPSPPPLYSYNIPSPVLSHFFRLAWLRRFVSRLWSVGVIWIFKLSFDECRVTIQGTSGFYERASGTSLHAIAMHFF